MKRKLLYVIPLILLALNVSPFALYKDSVGLSGKPPVLESLTPSHWKLLEFNVSFSGGLTTVTDNTKISSVMSQGATFRGFPFGAYFQNSHSSSTADSQSSDSATAWSWLWATVDGLIFIAVFLWVAKLNRPAKQLANVSQPTAQPVPQAPTEQLLTPATPDQTVQQVVPTDTPTAPYQPQVITPQAVEPQPVPTAEAPETQAASPAGSEPDNNSH